MPLLAVAGIPGEDELSAASYTDDGAVVADTGPEGTILDMYEVPASDLISQYTVKSGDTLQSIAKLFDVSPNTIAWANNIPKNTGVKPGQVLIILPITGVKHKVVKGDTITSLAKKYSGKDAKAEDIAGLADDIASYNGIGVGETLAVGTTIIVPDGEISVPDKAPVKSAVKSITGLAAKKGSPAANGYYIRPIEPNGSTIRKTQGFHDAFNAIDIGAPKGTPIHAMADGTVIAAKKTGFNGGYGLMVIIQHANGTQTLYAHQSQVLVDVGQRVSQGDVIGLVGSTGRSTGNHLHFEVRGAYPTPILY